MGAFRSYSAMPPVVQALLILNIGIFLVELSSAGQLIASLALWPLNKGPLPLLGMGPPPFEPWQLVTYSFLHGSWMHLLLNMYALWLFGARLENEWGSKAFALFYFVCVVGAGLVQLVVVSSASGPAYPTLGASGGVFGLLLAFGMMFPNERLMLIFPPIILKAKWFVLIYGAIELWAGVSGTQAGVAHFAHLGGMFFGLVLLFYWRKHPPGFR